MAGAGSRQPYPPLAVLIVDRTPPAPRAGFDATRRAHEVTSGHGRRTSPPANPCRGVRRWLPSPALAELSAQRCYAVMGQLSYSGRTSGVTPWRPIGSLRKAACYACHRNNTAVDNTFVQFYPTLFEVAKRL